jgi:subtilisin family serine protease
MKALKLLAAATVSVAAITASAHAEKYLLLANGAFPNDLDAKVIAAGGVLEKTFPFGVAVASSSNANFATKMKGVQKVVRDYGFDTEREEMISADDLAEFGNPPASGDNDTRFDLQYGHNYVGAVEAWNAGFRGQGVRVAVLDTGFDLDHVDLAAGIDFAASADMTGEGLSYQINDPFSHGTHTAGTIGARDNGIGTIGVAPECTLVLVKVLGDAGSGTFEDIIEGIYHAANQNVQVMNMSLGAVIPKGGPGTNEIAALANAVRHAMDYAEKQGVTVVVSAGNAASDLDGGDQGAVRFQTGLGSNVGVSATTAVGYYANGGANIGQDLIPTSYTNYGTSMVDFAAPGGDTLYPGNENCNVNGVVRPCWVLDLIFSTGSNLNPGIASYFWSGGTSMAAPHVAGVAALIISETGDSSPAHVRQELRARALEGGKPGADDFFGHGQANTGHE